MLKFLLLCVLFVLCWPLALAALLAFPIIWLMLLPFRLLAFALHGAFTLAWVAFVLWATWMVITLPFRLLSPSRATVATI
jgi:hypothetical protein